MFSRSINVDNDGIIKIFYIEISNGEIILCEEYERIAFNYILCFNHEILIFGEGIYKVSEANNNLFNNLFS